MDAQKYFCSRLLPCWHKQKDENLSHDVFIQNFPKVSYEAKEGKEREKERNSHKDMKGKLGSLCCSARVIIDY